MKPKKIVSQERLKDNNFSQDKITQRPNESTGKK